MIPHGNFLKALNGMLSFLLLALVHGWAKEPVSPPAKEDSKQVVFSEPDHLLPVDPYPGDWHVRYTQQLAEHFKLNESFDARMLIRPSFDAESVISLHREKKDPNEPFSEKKEDYLLTYSCTTSEKNIWYSMPENNDQKEQKKVTVSVVTTAMPKDLALRVLKVWERMMRRTSYNSPSLAGLDGTIFEFSMPGMYGETWSPNHRKSPLLFIELGASLIDYCKADDAGRVAARKSIEGKAAALELYLSKHP